MKYYKKSLNDPTNDYMMKYLDYPTNRSILSILMKNMGTYSWTYSLISIYIYIYIYTHYSLISNSLIYPCNISQ